MRAAAMLLLVLSPVIVAQTRAASPGLDIAVLVDQAAPHRDALRDLALDLVCRNAEENRIVHRVAVVSFGGLLRVDRPMAEIRCGGRVRAAAESRRRGDTSIRAALAMAETMFLALPPAEERRRAIVLISDAVPASRASADVVFLKADDGNRTEVLGRAHRLIAELVGTSGSEAARAGGAQTLILPPYLDTVVFDVIGGPKNVDVSLFAPDALQSLSGTNRAVEKVRVGDALSSVIVRRPAAGLWTFRPSQRGADIRVFSQQFFPRGLLTRPAQSPRQHDRLFVDYSIVDRDGSAIRERPEYPFVLQLTLIKPSGERRILAMERMDNGAGTLYRTLSVVDCDLPGRYWTDVEIATQDLKGQRITVFHDYWSGFAVTPAGRVDCVIRAGVRAACLSTPAPGTYQLLKPYKIGMRPSAVWFRVPADIRTSSALLFLAAFAFVVATVLVILKR